MFSLIIRTYFNTSLSTILASTTIRGRSRCCLTLAKKSFATDSKYFDIGWSSCYGVFDRQGYTLFWNSKYIFSKIDAFINDAYWSFLDMFSLIPIWCAHDSRHIPILFISIPNLPISDSLSGTLVYFGFVVNKSFCVFMLNQC